MGKIAVGMVRQAVERHPVKITLPEKARGKPRFCRPVIDLLIYDLERPGRVQVHGLVLVLLGAAFGIGHFQPGLLRQEVPDVLAKRLDAGGILAAPRPLRPVQQVFQRHIVPALEMVVDIPYHPGPVAAVVLDRVDVLQAVKNPPADPKPGLGRFITTHGVLLYIIR